MPIPGILRKVLGRVSRFFGIHPEVGDLLSASFKLSNPSEASFPTENLPFASHLIATGMWNYAFFQFYRHFAGPYWVEKQYNPDDPGYIPRASSLISINMTHRTWMGFRAPDSRAFSMVDPGGMVYPVVGYYGIETAIEIQDRILLPGRGDLHVSQSLWKHLPIPLNTYKAEGVTIRQLSAGFSVRPDLTLITWEYDSEDPVSLVLGIRPFNPEGASLIQSLKYEKGEPEIGFVEINEIPEIILFHRPDQTNFSHLTKGDSYFTGGNSQASHCSYGLATGRLTYWIQGKGRITLAARVYNKKELWDDKTKKRMGSGIRESISYFFPGRWNRTTPLHRRNHQAHHNEDYQDILKSDLNRAKNLKEKLRKEDLTEILQSGQDDQWNPEFWIEHSAGSWRKYMEQLSRFESARPSWNHAVHAILAYLKSLQTGDEITPGIYTYNQFWFRDAAYMLYSLSRWNEKESVERVLRSFPRYQTSDGFFHSHEGEWDSNGQAIWTIMQYIELTRKPEILEELFPPILKGANWITRKRKKGIMRKIMPTGFSAEHLGPADSYYWDNIWSIAGQHAASRAALILGKDNLANELNRETESYKKDLLEVSRPSRNRFNLLTAGPERPIDTGMIGSIASLYPLEIDIFPEEQIRNTVYTIYEKFFHHDLFFHPIIHSGYNIYLTLQTAQCLYRLGDVRLSRRIFKKVLSMATELWTYPEAIHPQTGGGVMGDGFHGWAFAEFLSLVREFTLHKKGSDLQIFRGLRKKELFDREVYFGPYPLDGGSVTIDGQMDALRGKLRIQFRGIEKTSIKRYMIYLPKSIFKRSAKFNCNSCQVEIQNNLLLVVSPEETLTIQYETE